MKNRTIKRIVAALSAAVMIAAIPAAYADSPADDIMSYPNLTQVEKTQGYSLYDYVAFCDENGKYGVKHNDEVVVDAVWDDVKFGFNYFGAQSFSSMSAKEHNALNDYNSVSFEYTSQNIYGYTNPVMSVNEVLAYADKVRASVKKDGKWGLINVVTGELIMPCEYKDLTIDNDKICFMTDADKFGFADLDGNEIISPVYDYVQNDISGDYIVVGRDYGYTVIDKTGREIMPLNVNEPSIVGGKYFSITRDDDCIEIYSVSGEKLFEKKAVSIMEYSDDMFMFDIGDAGEEETAKGRVEICGSDGKTILSAGDKYDGFIFFDGGNVCAYLDNRYPVNTNNNMPTVIAAETVDRDQDGISFYDYYDANGKMILEGWDLQGGFSTSGELIKISKNGKIGFADRRGNIVYEPQFDSESYPVATKDGKKYFLSGDGNMKELFGLGDAYIVRSDILVDSRNLYYSVSGYSDSDQVIKTGLLNKSGDFILPPVFESITMRMDGSVALGVNEGGESLLYTARLSENPQPIDVTEYINEPELDSYAQWFVNNGYVSGTTAEELRIDEATTRAEFLALLSRIDGWQVDESAPAAFNDTSGHWANGIIAEAKNRGLITADENGNFDPDGVIRYRDAYEILFREIGFPEDGVNLDSYGEDAFGRYVFASRSIIDQVPRCQTFRMLKGYAEEGRYYEYDPYMFDLNGYSPETYFTHHFDQSTLYCFN